MQNRNYKLQAAATAIGPLGVWDEKERVRDRVSVSFAMVYTNRKKKKKLWKLTANCRFGSCLFAEQLKTHQRTGINAHSGVAHFI